MSLYEKILEEPDHTKAKLPVWVHLIGKLTLQGIFGFGSYYFYQNGNSFISFLCGFVFVYLLVVLLFGHKIREEIMDQMTRI